MLLVRTVWGKYMSCATARLVGGWRWTTRFRWSAPLGVATGFTPTGGRWSVLAIGHRQRRRMLFVSSPIGTAWPPVAYPTVYNWAIEGPRNRPRPKKGVAGGQKSRLEIRCVDIRGIGERMAQAARWVWALHRSKSGCRAHRGVGDRQTTSA